MTKIKASEMVPLQWYKLIDVYYGPTIVLCVTNKPPTEKVGRYDLRVWSPSTETVNVKTNELVEHLPDCTGWDWKPEPTYAELSAKCGLKVGDRVKVTHKTEPAGWRGWQSAMDDMLGHVFTIAKITESRKNSDEHYFYMQDGNSGYYFPCTSLQKVEIKYRPFKGAEEFKPYRDRWVKRKDGVLLMRILSYSDAGVTPDSFGSVLSFTQLLDDMVFDDDAPCGVLHYEHTTPQ